MYTTKKEIADWLNKMGIVNYTINNDLTVDVKTKVFFSYKDIPEIPIQFGTIYSDFTIYNSGLLSLKGCPKIVKGNFNIAKNNLKSFQYCPEIVEGDFIGGENKVTDFLYMPKKIGKKIEMLDNPIKDLRNSIEFVGGTILTEPLPGFESYLNEAHYLIELSLSDINRYYQNVDLNSKLNNKLPSTKSSKRIKI